MRWRAEIHAGRGPVEVCEFVDLLAKRIESLARSAGFSVTRRAHEAKRGGSRAIRLELDGTSALPALLAAEAGTHALLHSARGRGARKRWFVGVDFWQEHEAETLVLSDVRLEVCRSGGPGGQHVNTTASAVRATHQPSGLSVRVERHRSQHRNKAEALALLAARVKRTSGEAARREQEQASLRAYRFERGAAVRTYCLDSKGRLVMPSKRGETDA